jgi:superfamily II DNA helicase RecQ
LEQPPLSVLEDSLKKRNFLPLYINQAEAINEAQRSNNVMVVTSSASGKTLCYNIPVTQAVLTESTSRALYIFPTKALAQDQLRTLREDFCPDIFSWKSKDWNRPQAIRAANALCTTFWILAIAEDRHFLRPGFKNVFYIFKGFFHLLKARPYIHTRK